MGDPDLLLLDEPTEGLAPLIVTMIADFIEVIKQEGMTVLLCEQNLKFALKHADRAYIVDNDIIKYHGTIAELNLNTEIKKKYLAVLFPAIVHKPVKIRTVTPISLRM